MCLFDESQYSRINHRVHLRKGNLICLKFSDVAKDFGILRFIL